MRTPTRHKILESVDKHGSAQCGGDGSGNFFSPEYGGDARCGIYRMGEGRHAVDASPHCCVNGLAAKFFKKPPRKGLVFPIRLKDPPLISHVFSLHATASGNDMRSVERTEKEILDVVQELSPSGNTEDGSSFSTDSESTSSKPSTSCSGVEALPHNNASMWHGISQIWKKKKKSLNRLSSFPPFGVPKIMKKKNGREKFEEDETYCGSYNGFCFFGPSLKTFSLLELENATNNFSEENLIGKGGFAKVYKGELEDGQLVAIKRLLRGTPEERTSNFLSELGIIVHMDHPNVAKLVGVGLEDDMHLVLQLSPNGNLETLLHGSKEKLDWGVRYKVAIGTAEGLEYLHERCQKRIIHRDIKPSNILLSEDFEPQICDFGLAKWLPDQMTHHILSSFEGTFGYVSPEYSMHGIVDEKTDVFAFGVLLLELISGREALDASQGSLIGWARPIIVKNELKDLVDPSLGDAYDKEQMKNMAKTANLCIQHTSLLRPKMSQVFELLGGGGGGEEGARSIKKIVQQKPLHRRTYSEEIYDVEEYNDTKYLRDLSRHKQLAMDFQEAACMNVEDKQVVAG